MPDTSTFEDLQCPRPDADQLAQAHADLMRRWAEAASVPAQLALIREWDHSQIEYETSSSLAHIHYQQATDSADAKEAQEFYDNLHPTVLGHNVGFLKAVTESAVRPELEAALGGQIFKLWESFLGTFEPTIADAKRQESALDLEYSALLAGLQIPFQGETHNLSTLRGFYGNADRSVRAGAQAACDQALSAHQDQLDQIYDKMVKLRHGMAQTLGYDNFIPLGYRQMDRIGYGPEDVAQFRQQVREVVVPLATRIHARRASTLGVTDYMFHDESVRDLQGVPCPAGDHDWMMDRATEMFDELGEDFGGFFRMLRERRLLDLKSRTGKAGGGFCCGLPSFEVPFIFANFDGTQNDVNVFTHECGHAFQNYQSRSQPLREYFWPTTEAAEVHSMSLEFLTHPFMELFFKEDAERFRVGHIESGLLFLPYGVAVDEFQHMVYAEPNATPQQRAEMWREVERTYLPHRRYQGTPYYAGGRVWQRQRHIYGMPFYYIDYCLAGTCAMQMWRASQHDPADALKRYRRLCQLGGSLSFPDLLKAVDLKNPFAEGCLAEVCESVEAAIGL
jgi:M3 family oligoendopeptidase